MIKHDCEICRGSGVIRPPIYRRAQAAVDFNVDAITESSRIYPCPECADTTPQERVAIVQYHTLVDSMVGDPAYVEAAKSNAAHQLIAGLLKGNFIRFKRGPNDAREFNFPVQATIGVVSQKNVADLEARVAEHQEQLAREVMAEAERAIDHWGSYYNHQSIRKDDATRSIREALAAVLAKRASWKAA